MSSSPTASFTSSTRFFCRRCNQAVSGLRLRGTFYSRTLAQSVMRPVPSHLVLWGPGTGRFGKWRPAIKLIDFDLLTPATMFPAKEFSMNRRNLVSGGAAFVAALAGTTALWRIGRPASAQAESFEITKTEAEWRAISDRCPIRRSARGRHRARRNQPAQPRKARRHLPLRWLRPGGLFFRSQIRFRHRLAEFLGVAAERNWHQGRQLVLFDPHRSPLPPLRRPFRPYFRRWAAADRQAPLPERPGPCLQAGAA